MTVQNDAPAATRPIHSTQEAPVHTEVSVEALERVRAMRMARYQAAQTVAAKHSEDRKASAPTRSTMKASTSQPTLIIRRVDEPERTTLYLSGVLDLANVLRLRDEAFCAIGARPKALTMDLHLLSRVEFAGVNTLVTIGRVARLTKIAFSVCASATLTEMILETGLFNILTLEGDPATEIK